MPKQAEVKRDGVINPQNYNLKFEICTIQHFYSEPPLVPVTIRITLFVKSIAYMYFVNMNSASVRQKGGDLTQSYDKSPYTHGNVKRAVTTQKTPQKSSIKQRLRTDLGRSVGVTTATQLVWLTWFTGPTFPLPATAV